MEDKKVTKKDLFEEIKEVISSTDVENKEDLVSFIEKQIEILENKAAKSRERAAEKRAAGDELRAVVKGLLTNEDKTVDEITEELVSDGQDVTRAKVVARLTQLVKTGEAKKADKKLESGRTVKVYSLAD